MNCVMIGMIKIIILIHHKITPKDLIQELIE